MSGQDDEDQLNPFRRQSERNDAGDGEQHVSQLDDAPLQPPHRAKEPVRIRGSIPAPEDWPRGHPRPPWYPPEPPLEPKSKRKSDPEPVGYGKPPREHRFKPGQSGNPKGRAPGSKNRPKPVLFDDKFGNDVLAEFYREVKVTVQGETETMPVSRLAMRAIMLRAAKGHVQAFRIASDLVHRIETRQAAQQWEDFQTLATFKIEGERELARRERLGLTHLPPLVPHPEDIVIDVRRVRAEINGPLTMEEKEAWDETTAWLAWMEETIASFRADLDQEADPKDRRRTRRIIKALEERLAEVGAQLPDWVPRQDSRTEPFAPELDGDEAESEL